MSDTLKLSNSIWNNGIQVDSDGYAVFYPLGSNKSTIPTTVSEWPEGTKLISPFVYDENDNLVGFCDTKAMTTNDGNSVTVTLPYEHIEIDLSSADSETLTIHAPKASTKTVTWDGVTTVEIPELNYKYKGCKTISDITAIEPNYKTVDVVNGAWTEILSDLEDATDMFFDHYDSSIDDSVGSPNLISFSGDLSSVITGDWMFYNCNNFTTFNSDLSSMTSGYAMFWSDEKLTNFSSILSSLTNGAAMFGCTSLTSFDTKLPKLENGDEMFCYCSNLKNFNVDLSSMTTAEYMFFECFALESFTSDVSSLTYGFEMFHDCHSLTFVKTDMSKLQDGDYMFYNNYNMTSFDAPLDSLYYGYGMFHNCSKLTSFNGNLNSLTNGYQMFRECKLDTDSIRKIADTIKDVRELTNGVKTYDDVYKMIHFGLQNETPTEEETKLLTIIHNKGWDVFVNGWGDGYEFEPIVTTSIDETSSITPYYAKPIPSDEKHAEFIDENGNYFDVIGGKTLFVKDIDTYGMFTSREDAIAQMRLTPHVPVKQVKTKIERN